MASNKIIMADFAVTVDATQFPLKTLVAVTPWFGGSLPIVIFQRGKAWEVRLDGDPHTLYSVHRSFPAAFDAAMKRAKDFSALPAAKRKIRDDKVQKTLSRQRKQGRMADVTADA